MAPSALHPKRTKRNARARNFVISNKKKLTACRNTRVAANEDKIPQNNTIPRRQILLFLFFLVNKKKEL